MLSLLYIGAIAVTNGQYPNNVWPFHIHHLNCTGNELSITDCTVDTDYTCPESHDTASVVCQGECYYHILRQCFLFLFVWSQLYTGCYLSCILSLDARHSKGVTCNHGDVRLVHGSTQHEGRLEVCMNHLWGSVCSSPHTFRWTSIDSSVVCGQLGHMRRGILQTHTYNTHIHVYYVSIQPLCLLLYCSMSVYTVIVY